jgi:hypothetical protein
MDRPLRGGARGSGGFNIGDLGNLLGGE